MNGMILQAPAENKDIKFIGKKGADTKSEEGDNLFENLIAQLVADEEGGEGNSFLLAKLLNLQSDFKDKGKIISEFSKGDILTDEKGEEVALEDLFKIALMLKSGAPEENINKIAKELNISLDDKKVITALKEATNIKELLKIADKNGIKVKNFEFLNPEAALSLKDKKIVQKITSEEIFKLIDPKNSSKNISLSQNVLSKAIRTNIKPTEEKNTATTLTSLLSKDIKKVEKTTDILEEVYKVDTPSTEETEHKTQKILLKEVIQPSFKTVTKENALVEKVQSTKILEKEIKTKEVELPQESKVATFKQEKAQKSKHTPLATLLQTESNTKELKPLTQKLIQTDEIQNKSETSIRELTDAPLEKNNNSNEIKSETIYKTKDTPDVKKTFNTFAMEFKEKVEAYKAPLMKINMQLSPANLGDVDVTLISRGNNLQVNINSNANTLALFVQNQAEFKNSLVNMGFSDLQMNFGDGKGEQRGQNHKKDDQQQSNYHDSLEEENEEGINMILPNYV